MHMQAWYLRKCMSLYNDVVRRPHLPREHGIRRLLLDTKVDLTLYGPCPEDEGAEADDALENGENEESEDECMEDDPCPLAYGSDTPVCVYYIYLGHVFFNTTAPTTKVVKWKRKLYQKLPPVNPILQQNLELNCVQIKLLICNCWFSWRSYNIFQPLCIPG